jgi:molecular chaperone GrpE (heat shock protein)
MPEELPHTEELDFAGEMQHLAYEAEHQRGAAPRSQPPERKDWLNALGLLLRPMAHELESIRRATSENSAQVSDVSSQVSAVGKAVAQQQNAAQSLENIHQQLARLGAIETANQRLFDALHSELKGYKDNFLFDALQKPFVRDLVSIFDDFSSLHAQMLKRLEALEAAPAPSAEEQPPSQGETAFLRNLTGNVENQLHHMLEVFLRMEVVPSRSPRGAALDKRVHRTVGFEPAATGGEDGQVARSLKPGFTWRDRMVRPEEVVVQRWNPDAAPRPENPAPSGLPAAQQ